MTQWEDRIRDALHASAETTVSRQDIAAAEARFRSHQVVPAQRPLAWLVAATAAVTVVAALVWWLARPEIHRVGPSDEPAPSTPTQTQAPRDDRVGIIGPPPPGTSPTGAATGSIVAGAELYNTGSWVYADGRLINVVRNQVTSDEFQGFVVRQLTPSGVEAIRSFMLDGTKLVPGPLDHGEWLGVRKDGRLRTVQPFADCGNAHMEGSVGGLPAVQTRVCPALEHPETWLPASAWDDPTYRPFIPVRFQVCLSPSTDAASLLPEPAADTFLASPSYGGNGSAEDCRALATSDARSMADQLEEAGAVSDNGQTFALSLHPGRRAEGDYGLVFQPILPHGGTFCDCG